jgi:uncharacterized MAPEG superfamily protein
MATNAASLTQDLDVGASPEGSFADGTFKSLGGLGMGLGLAIPAAGYYLLAGTVAPIVDMGQRLAFGMRWMALASLAVVLGFQVAGLARFGSPHADGSAPPSGSALEMHRRYLQNTLEQFAYFFVAQMALVTLLPATALHLTPIFAVQFLVGRLIFWRGYLTNPAYRSLGLTMNHSNLLVLGYVLFRLFA